MVKCIFGGKGSELESVNNDRSVCGTAPATPGLLISLVSRNCFVKTVGGHHVGRALCLVGWLKIGNIILCTY